MYEEINMDKKQDKEACIAKYGDYGQMAPAPRYSSSTNSAAYGQMAPVMSYSAPHAPIQSIDQPTMRNQASTLTPCGSMRWTGSYFDITPVNQSYFNDDDFLDYSAPTTYTTEVTHSAPVQSIEPINTISTIEPKNTTTTRTTAPAAPTTAPDESTEVNTLAPTTTPAPPTLHTPPPPQACNAMTPPPPQPCTTPDMIDTYLGDGDEMNRAAQLKEKLEEQLKQLKLLVSNTEKMIISLANNPSILGKISSVKGLRMADLNCRSFIRYLDKIRLLLQDPCVNIFSFNETRLDPSIHDSELIIPGYKLIRFDRNRHGGWVLLCVNDSLNSSRILDGSDFDILGNNVIVITSIYRPPSANVTYYQNMISYIDKVLSFGFDSVFLGDFNLDFIDQGIELAKVNEICNIFHLQLDTASCIDLCFSNVPEKYIFTDVISLNLNDHFLIFTYTRIQLMKLNNVLITLFSLILLLPFLSTLILNFMLTLKKHGITGSVFSLVSVLLQFVI